MSRIPIANKFASAGALVAGLAAAAHAQGTLTFSDQFARAEIYYDAGSGPVGNSGLSQDFSGADFYAVENRPFNGGGLSGRAYAEHGATFTPSNPLIGGQFSSVVLDSCTSAEIDASNIGPHVVESANGIALGTIEFSLTAPMSWTWTGGWQGYSHNTGSYNEVSASMSLVDVVSGTPYVNQSQSSINGEGDWSSSFFLGGTLGPGLYRLSWGHESLVTGGNTPFGFFQTAFGGAPLVSCINSTFTLTPAPGSAAMLAMGGALAARRRRA